MIAMRGIMETEGFQRSLQELLKLKQDIPKVVKRVAGGVVNDCVKLTPPFGGRAFTESWPSQRQMGNRAVENDIRKVFLDIRNLGVVKGRKKNSIGMSLWKASSKSDHGAAIQILLELNIRADSFDDVPTVEKLNSVRDKRGRTSERRGNFWVKGGIPSLVKQVQKHVGKGKHGWMAAVKQLGVKGIPVWVSRQSNESGACKITGEGTSKFAVEFENTVPFIQRKGRDLGIVKAAFESVRIKLDREVKAILAYRFKKAKATR